MLRRSLLFLALVLITAGVFAAGTQSTFYVPEKVMADYSKKYGEQAARRLSGLLTLMESLKDSSEDKKVIEINNYFNQVPYQSDQKTWGVADYWASRLEFLGVGKGDCEDFSVAKFLTLIQLGVPEAKLFLTYVKATGYAEQAHLVVSYYKKPGTVPFVLDNYNKQILPASKRPDLVPVYSFTANDLYLQRQKGLGKRVDPASSKNLEKLKSIDLEILKR